MSVRDFARRLPFSPLTVSARVEARASAGFAGDLALAAFLMDFLGAVFLGALFFGGMADARTLNLETGKRITQT